jgi:predicted CopG family antitoxin
MKESSIGIDRSTKEKLEKLKVHPRQSYEEIILELLKLREKEK